MRFGSRDALGCGAIVAHIGDDRPVFLANQRRLHVASADQRFTVSPEYLNSQRQYPLAKTGPDITVAVVLLDLSTSALNYPAE